MWRPDFSARDVDETRRVGSLLLAAPAINLPLFALVGALTGGPRYVTSDPTPDRLTELMMVVVVPIILTLTILWFRHSHSHLIAKLFFPIVTAGMVLITVANIATKDASTSAQAYFVLPAVFAGYTLRRDGAIGVLIMAILGVAATTLSVLPLHTAMADTITTATVVTMLTFLLKEARDRQEASYAAVRRMADFDALTGLENRTVLDRQLAEALADPRCAENGVALLVIDLDKFKFINDTFGHPAGDAALEHLARILRSMSRDGDLACRLGGDEMAMLLRDCPYDVALQRAHDICSVVRRSPVTVVGGHEVTMSTSIGFAHSPTNATAPEALYQAADEGLYQAKRNGRDQVGAAPLKTSDQALGTLVPSAMTPSAHPDGQLHASW